MTKIIVKVIAPELTKDREIKLCDTKEQFKSFTVRQLKEKIWDQTGYSDYDFRVIFTSKQLDDDDSLLSQYGIQDMSVIHLVKRLRGGGMGPGKGDGGMGDKEGKNRSMEKLSSF